MGRDMTDQLVHGRNYYLGAVTCRWDAHDRCFMGGNYFVPADERTVRIALANERAGITGE